MLRLDEKSDFEYLKKCPWCSSSINSSFKDDLFVDDFGCPIMKCPNCSVVFARKRLNSSGRMKFWADWSSRIHTSDPVKLAQRKQMYKLDFDFISKYIKKGAKVLDVGCGEGDFLDIFKNKGFSTSGVEFGEEAARITSKKHICYMGVFPQIIIPGKYDLIIFRGALQYFEDPKRYLHKALSLLTSKGLIFITAQPNMNSFCFNLFKKNFPIAVTGVDFVHYTEQALDDFFCRENNLDKIASVFPYEKTPYADIENDVLKVAKAIELRRKEKAINFKGPAFYGNMMSLVYRKATKNK